MEVEKRDIRFDLKIIASWIEPGSRVLDLGCGEGTLLHYLREHRQVVGTGIEQHEAEVAACIAKGLTVLQGDLNQEVLDYPDRAFDYVILSQTLQQVYRPRELITSLMRIGSRVIVSFPNFSHWSIRLQVLMRGMAPKNQQLPYDWYNSPNIRVITLKDFRRFVEDLGFKVMEEAPINTQNQDRYGSIVRFLPNLRATYGVFMIGRANETR